MADLQSIIVALDIMAFAAAVAMAFQAWRAHRVVGSGQSLAFAASFSLITVGVFARLVIDALIEVGPPLLPSIRSLGAVIGSQMVFLLLSALCLLSAYTLLLLVVERIRNLSMWILVFLLVVFTIFLARDIFLLTHVMSLVLLGLLAHRFWTNYLEKGSTNALIVYLAFFTLMVSHFFALASSASRWLHVVFLSLRLVGFFLLFAVVWRSSRR